MPKLLYTAKASVKGGRSGSAKTSDGALEVNLKPPVERGGPGGGVNPEQLFAIGYGACFEGSIRGAARAMNMEVTESSIESHVTFNQDDEGGFFIGAELDITLPTVSDPEVAKELVRKAHQRCPYSKATRGNIDVKFTVNGQPLDH